MKATLADDRGRITLGTKVVERYGKKFVVVETPRDIVLVPISNDPIAELARIGKQGGIDKYTLKELKRMAAEEAEEEISG
ncbi:hypothetical protein HYV85_05490 [Candidatus Woesearchaeota archaeon]|nr:hypothetical protein [Candidatus Woesearchaeota archaeon]